MANTNNGVPIRRISIRPPDCEKALALTSDAALGIAWWNAMTERARLAALKAVEPEGRASPAEAWDHWRYGFACEETAHG